MSTSPIPQTIDILSREKGIDPQVIISAIEDAVVIAARKQFKTGEDLRARYNAETGDVELFALMTVVDEVQDSATEISLADVEAMGSKAPKSAISRVPEASRRTGSHCRANRKANHISKGSRGRTQQCLR